MANIKDYINKIRSAVYGEEVRGAIADSIESMNVESSKAVSVSNNVNSRQTSLEKQFNEQIKNMTLKDPSSAEIVAMRTDINGTTYSTANDRIDSIEIGLLYPIKAGEVGVINKKYDYGDCRRYGMFANGESCQEESDNALKSCAVLGIPLILKPGLYKTQLNVGYSNSYIKFEKGAEVTGLIHVYVPDGKEPIENIKFEGDVITYDRFGTRNLNGLFFDRIIVKSDGSKATDYPGINGRGCHISPNTKNVFGHELIVEGLDDDGFNNHAAISIDGYSGNPSNINIDTIVVKDSEVHGVYLTGTGHNIGNIIVENFGKGEFKGTVGMEDSGGLQQSQELKGVWLNRCWNTNIGNITVSCSGANANAKYCVMIDETGKGSNIGAVNIGNINISNTTNVNCFMTNDKNSACTNVNCNIDNITIVNNSTTTDESLLTIADFSRVNINNVNIKNILEANAFQCLSRYECNVKNMTIDDCKKQAIYLDGICNIDNLYVNRAGDLDDKYLFEMTKKANYTKFGKLNLDCKVKLNAKAFKSQASYFTVDYIRTGLHMHEYGTVYLTGCTYSKINFLNAIGTNTDKTGTALSLENLIGCTFSNVTALYFNNGIVMSGTLTRCSFSNSISSNNGNANTNLAAGAVQTFNCVGITL